MATGIRVVSHDPFLRFFTLQGGVANFALTGYYTLLVLFLVRDLDLDPGKVGAVLAAGSVGGLAGAGIARRASARLGDARAMVVLQVAAGPPALLIALGEPGLRVALGRWAWPWSAPASSLRTCCAAPSGCATRRPSWPARTTSTSSLVNFGTMPLAGLAAGWLGAHVGVRETVTAMAAVYAASAFAPLFGPYGRIRDPPDQPMATCSSGSTATARNTTAA